MSTQLLKFTILTRVHAGKRSTDDGNGWSPVFHRGAMRDGINTGSEAGYDGETVRRQEPCQLLSPPLASLAWFRAPTTATQGVSTKSQKPWS